MSDDVTPSAPRHGPSALVATMRFACAGLLAVAAIAVRANSAESVFATEAQIKAAYLLRFAQLVEWPEATLGPGAQPLVIGVLGKNPFGDVLEVTLRGRQAQGRSLQVRVMSSPTDTGGVHVVYFGAMSRPARRRALVVLRGRPFLTVGEAREFLDDGGAIALKREADRVRFDVNLESARAANLKINARILQLAEVIRGAN